MGWISITIVTILPKAIYIFSASSIKMPMVFSTELEKSNSKISKVTEKIKTVLKKSKFESILLPAFKLYYKTTVIKTLWNWHKSRHIDQQNRIKIPEVNLHLYG